MRTPKTKVRRATVHLPASESMPVTVRGYGFRASCECGWESRALKTFREARAESKGHAEYHARAERVSIAGPL